MMLLLPIHHSPSPSGLWFREADASYQLYLSVAAISVDDAPPPKSWRTAIRRLLHITRQRRSPANRHRIRERLDRIERRLELTD
ncbi:hypothetical protein NR402_14430 [Acidithiobacillus ferrooxidans]|uniref:hypothetical protein n=1 Tax=Acidithiobacillus ferrooxidans TaxID=920 RepID=UPI00214B07EA|nr:hypothetical protein [Acidithiobacillus ferrooxidans]MCR2831470.1 hypothetical protein [Acidithiobacillus ferrooxidans]